jgi:hypothetical protein
MDLQKVIAELREEFERIQQAITALERLTEGKRRGRPLKGLSKSQAVKSVESDEYSKEQPTNAEPNPPISDSAGA